MTILEKRVTKLIYDAKSFHYVAFLSHYKSDPKVFWIIFNEIIPRNYSNAPSRLKINGISIYQPNLIAEEFNTYFSIVSIHFPVQRAGPTFHH